MNTAVRTGNNQPSFVGEHSRVLWNPVCRTLNSGRLHLHYGPIDLLIDVSGTDSIIEQAHEAARQCFSGVLEGLVAELSLLRKPCKAGGERPSGVVAQRMWQACQPHTSLFVTPMAAVAGAVADHVLTGIVQRVPSVPRVWVNNGGDIAFHLAPGESTKLGVYRVNAKRAATLTVHSTDVARGVATSGWPGRSMSLGIADAVTVLAPTAADADVAATLIANAVRLNDQQTEQPFVVRQRAQEISCDTDLHDQWVVTDVFSMPSELCADAVSNGQACAEKLLKRAPITAVFIECQGHSVAVGACV